MSGKQLTVWVVAAILILGGVATAQDERNELTGMVGRVFISDQGLRGSQIINPFVRSGKGLSFEVAYGRYLTGNSLVSASFEVPAVVNFDEDLNSGANVVPRGYRQYFVTPSARANLFPATAISPWVSLGAGIARFSEDKHLVYYGSNPGHSSTSFAIQAGLGLDVRIWRRFSLRGEARDFWSGSPNYPLANTGKTRQHNYFVGAGVIWHF